MEQYKQEVSKYGKKDAVIALCFYLVLTIFAIVFWVVVDHFELPGRMSSIIYSILAVVSVVALVLINKQGISSLGIHSKNWKPALLLGVVLSVTVLLTMGGLIVGIIYGSQFNPLNHIIMMLLYLLIMAAYEDIIFIGYIQTRLYGLIKKDVLAVIAGAFLFALIHIPMGLATGGALWTLLMGMPFWIIMHIIMNGIFRRYTSIIPVTMFHMFFNFSQTELWSAEGFVELPSYMVIILVLALALVLVATLIVIPKINKFTSQTF